VRQSSKSHCRQPLKGSAPSQRSHKKATADPEPLEVTQLAVSGCPRKQVWRAPARTQSRRRTNSAHAKVEEEEDAKKLVGSSFVMSVSALPQLPSLVPEMSKTSGAIGGTATTSRGRNPYGTARCLQRGPALELPSPSFRAARRSFHRSCPNAPRCRAAEK
jgi:hypothetical protein